MAVLHRARACIIANDATMHAMLRRMLLNCAYFDEYDIPETLEMLKEQVQLHAKEDGGTGDTFLYEMISPRRYADAEPGTCRLDFLTHPGNLMTACFSYDSAQEFQVHDWLDLHNRIGQPMTVILHASEDFSLDKGEIILAQGHAQENWDTICETWLWLMEQYECGLPPAEGISRLKQLQKTLEDEEYDTDIPQLLSSCLTYLKSLCLSTEDKEGLGRALEQSLQEQQFGKRMELEYLICESALWETQHLAKWEATLSALQQAWKEQ